MKEENLISQSMLPPSGLAKDVLREEESGSSGEQSRETAVDSGSRRLYAFADSLEDNEKVNDTTKSEQHFDTWVTFSLNGSSFGLPVSSVQEIIRVSSITKVPHAPEPVRGITNIRGRVLPVVDLRVRLGMQTAEFTSSSRILVVESRGRLIGLSVDAVQQVMRLSEEDTMSVPPDVMTVNSDYITGVYRMQDKLVILLNVDRLLSLRDRHQTSEPRGA
ncbi:MAG: chemotaxis protein CheW [Nitrospirota bacterium]